MMRLTILVLTVTVAATPAIAQTPSPSAPAKPSYGDQSKPGDEPVDSVSSLFTGAAKGLRRLPSVDTALILGAAGAVSLAVHPRDADLTRWSVRSSSLDHFFEFGAIGGGTLVQFGGAATAYTIGRAVGSHRVSAVGADLVRAQMLTTLLTQGLKVSVRRDRPDGTRFSFPSGHSSGSFATAVVLQRHFGWKVGVPAYAVGCYIAGSRLQENRHYASDVIFGAGIGIAAGRSITVGRGSAVVSPMLSPGAVGIGVRWLGPR